jgi:hypothetical protein
MTDQDNEIVFMHDVLDALEAAISAAPSGKRKALADALDGYHNSYPEDFHWATGAQAPSLLQHLVMVIDWSSRSEEEPKRRSAVRLADRKPQGNA